MGSSSTTVNAGDFTAENLTFENSAGDNVGQAVALMTNGDRLVFRHCRFLGFQDTLYPAGGGRVYFQDCYVTGDTDFIFGDATAVFDPCPINATDARLNYHTAANTRPRTPSGHVFFDGKLTAGPDVGVGAVYLGRPWQWDRGSKSATTFNRCQMGPHVNPAGRHPWGPNNDHPENNTPTRSSGRPMPPANSSISRSGSRGRRSSGPNRRRPTPRKKFSRATTTGTPPSPPNPHGKDFAAGRTAGPAVVVRRWRSGFIPTSLCF